MFALFFYFLMKLRGKVLQVMETFLKYRKSVFLAVRVLGKPEEIELFDTMTALQ